MPSVWGVYQECMPSVCEKYSRGIAVVLMKYKLQMQNIDKCKNDSFLLKNEE
jgi:hypothetical protein